MPTIAIGSSATGAGTESSTWRSTPRRCAATATGVGWSNNSVVGRASPVAAARRSRSSTAVSESKPSSLKVRSGSTASGDANSRTAATWARTTPAGPAAAPNRRSGRGNGTMLLGHGVTPVALTLERVRRQVHQARSASAKTASQSTSTPAACAATRADRPGRLEPRSRSAAQGRVVCSTWAERTASGPSSTKVVDALAVQPGHAGRRTGPSGGPCAHPVLRVGARRRTRSGSRGAS